MGPLQDVQECLALLGRVLSCVAPSKVDSAGEEAGICVEEAPHKSPPGGVGENFTFMWRSRGIGWSFASRRGRLAPSLRQMLLSAP